MKIKKSCDFVEAPGGKLYLPRPNTWMGGWARHMWFQHCLGKKASIASPEFYEELSTNYGKCMLIEYTSGVVRVIEPETPDK